MAIPHPLGYESVHLGREERRDEDPPGQESEQAGGEGAAGLRLPSDGRGRKLLLRLGQEAQQASPKAFRAYGPCSLSRRSAWNGIERGRGRRGATSRLQSPQRQAELHVLKVLSPLIGRSREFELLQFVYDLFFSRHSGRSAMPLSHAKKAILQSVPD